jgi:two-component system sensor histidine kinase UhpB
MKRSSLYKRVFGLNAAILVVATLVVAITPATVSFPVELTEAFVLAGGLLAMLVLNAVALRAALAPVDRLMRSMRAVDSYRPGERLEVTGPEEVRELVAVFNDMLDRLEAQRRESGRLALTAQEGERRRVAQELHDDVGQALTGVLLRLESLARRAPAELQADMRAAALARRVEEESGLEVTLRVAPDLDGLDEESELVLYRVAQEGLTNAARHARATRVDLTLRRSESGETVLRILDDGVGLPDPPATRYGIVGMRERAMLIGATLTVETGRTGGVEVTLTAPPPQ